MPSNNRLHDLSGQRFGRLTVQSFCMRISTGPGRGTYWSCDCTCGTKDYITTSKSLNTANLGKRGGVQSCGCLIKEQAAANCIRRSRTHGETRLVGGKHMMSPEYRCWRTIMVRCYNPNFRQYHDYGGRGIKVCERWRHSFPNFLIDMGRKPSPELSIERRRVNDDYSPDNCYWATDSEQRRNRRTTKWITINGRSQPLVDWLRELGVPKPTYYSRIKAGKTPAEALLGV